MATDWNAFRQDVFAQAQAERERKSIPDRFTVSKAKFEAALKELGATHHGPETSRCVLRAWYEIEGPAGTPLKIELVFNTYLRAGGERWYGRAGEWNEIDVDQYETHVKGKGARGRYDDGAPPYVRVHQQLWALTR